MCLFIVELVDAASRGLHHHTSGAEVGGREGEEGSGLREGISSGHLRNCVGEKPAKAAGYFPSRETRGQVALSRDLRRKRRQNKDMSGRPSWYFEMFLVE